MITCEQVYYFNQAKMKEQCYLYIGEWSVHLGILAERPNPLSSHCFVRFDSFRAILFGGISKDGQMNETRIFNLRERVELMLLAF